MTCERLVCAACAGQVVEAGCPVCSAARADHHHPAGPLTPSLLLAVLALLAVALLLTARLGS